MRAVRLGHHCATSLLVDLALDSDLGWNIIDWGEFILN